MKNRWPAILCIIVSTIVAVINVSVLILAMFLPTSYWWGFMDNALTCALIWIPVGLVFNIIATIVGRKDIRKIYLIASWLLFGLAIITMIFNPVYFSV